MTLKNDIEKNKHLKQNTFKVPDNYFEGLEKRLAAIAQNEPKVVAFKPEQNLKKWLSMAATILLLISAGWYFWPNANSTSEVVLTEEDVATFIDYDFLYYTETALIDNLTLEDLEQINLTSTDFTDYIESTQPASTYDYYLYTDI